VKEISKTYSPKEVELKLIKFWEEHGFYTPEVDSQKPKFSVVIPPPNVTGNLTIGHILDNTIQDIYVRWKRMSGYNVLWLPGTDHAGIATQTVVEKKLKVQKLTRYDLGRETFVKNVWEWKEVYHKNITAQLKRMGASVDWTRERFTMDEGLSKAVRTVFVDLYKKGLVYKGKRIINWDPEAQTALSDEEVIYKEKKDKLYYIKYPLIGNDGKVTDEYLTIATTRPETMLGDTAVAVHPDDSRYKLVIDRKVLLPVAERPIPVIADSYVDVEFGTGALKITPAHDPNDFEIGSRHKLESLQVIDQRGYMNELAGKYAGIDRFEARKQIVNRLEESGLIEKIEDYVHNVGYSERGGVIIEPYLSDQWFVSMASLAVPALEAVTAGKIKFFPERWAKVYEHWMTNIRDWCISRQLWWGHQIPVWYNKKDGSRYCEVDPPRDIENWEQDPDVLDTWFSSWLWPFSTMGWPDETRDLKVFYPTDFLSTAPDIIFFWVARMIMASLEFTGKVPFYDVYYHNIIRDEKGRKLSKSLGNSPDVIDVMNEYGTDALRFTLVYLAPQGVDVYFSREKCELGRNFANKIWNASRFLLMKKHQAEHESIGLPLLKHEPDIFDRWIDSRLNSTISTYIDSLTGYRINEATKVLHEFVWGDFCDWYIELLKVKSAEHARYSEQIFDKAVEVFESILKLLHPVMPFITEELWQSIKERKPGESITISDFPILQRDLISPEIEKEVGNMQQLVTAIRNLRAELNLNPSVKCNVLVSCENEAAMRMVNELSPYMKILAKIEELDVIPSSEFEKQPKFKSITSVVGSYQVYLRIEGLIDIEQEKMRLSKEIERTRTYLDSLDKKLNNDNFLKKASKNVVENEKHKQEDFRSKLEKLQEHYNLLSD
jgi:valyl-tRNA synthetase